MASVSLPASQAPWPGSSQLHPHHAYEYSQPARYSTPPFTFPMQEPEPEPAQSSRPTPRNPAPLPNFSFPQAPAPPSPSHSPSSPSHKPSGHRRSRGSELVGLDIPASGNSASSDGSGQPAPPTPSLLPTPGPGLSAQPSGRRTHAHRRSAAISSVDLTAVAKAFPPMPVGAGSAPVTPTNMQQQHALNEDAAKPTSRTVPTSSPRSPLPSAGSTEDSKHLAPPPASAPGDAAAAAVPAFHRPLSTASDNSASTVRQKRPVSESVEPEPVSKKKDKHSVRPKTAGAPSKLSKSERIGNERSRRALSVSGSASLAGAKSDSADIPDVPPLPKGKHGVSTQEDTSDYEPAIETNKSNASSRPASEKKAKKKKVRSWAGILSRKAKKRSQKKTPISRKTPTPPPAVTRNNSEIGSTVGVDFDEDNTVIIRSPTSPAIQPPLSPQAQPEQQPTLEASWKPRSFYEQGKETDMFSPVIDLDAALGPFNTPKIESEDPQASGFSIATQRMYSGGRRGQFVGPEMRYHRRAESAPEMPPLDRNTLTMSRFGGASTMANPDVFDEEEEDAFLAGNDDSSNSPSSDATSRQNDESVDGDSNNDDETGLGIHIADSADTARVESSESRPSTAHHDMPITPNDNNTEDLSRPQQARDRVQIVDADQFNMRFDKSLNPTPSRSPLEDKRPVTSPDLVAPKFGFPSDLPPPPCTTNFSSPDPESASLDAPRLHTASSSVTDRQTSNSNYSGEPGPDYTHGSTEDVPSLTSTASTMTGNMPQGSSTFYARGRGGHSRSASTAVPPKTSGSGSTKRASMISLTKLVGGGSSGEKSKLCHEEKPPRDEPIKSRRKTHRFSRIMHFWKDKDRLKGPE